MIYLVVTVKVKAGKMDEYIMQFKPLAAKTRQEKGCIDYLAAVDFDSGLPPQTLEKDVVTILERWESLEALHAHLASPHMAAHFEKEKDLVEAVTIKVLKEA